MAQPTLPIIIPWGSDLPQPVIQSQACDPPQHITAQLTPPVIQSQGSDLPWPKPTLPAIQSLAIDPLQLIMAQPTLLIVQCQGSDSPWAVAAQLTPPVIQTQASNPLQLIVALPTPPVVQSQGNDPPWPIVAQLTPPIVQTQASGPPQLVVTQLTPSVVQSQGNNPPWSIVAQPTPSMVQTQASSLHYLVMTQPTPPIVPQLIVQSQAGGANLALHVPDQESPLIPQIIPPQPTNTETSSTSQETGGKHVQQPSKRNQLSNSIGMNLYHPKKGQLQEMVVMWASTSFNILILRSYQHHLGKRRQISNSFISEGCGIGHSHAVEQVPEIC